MNFYKGHFVCVLIGAFSGISVAEDLPNSSLLQGYGVTADKLRKPVQAEVLKGKPEPSRFPISAEKPLVNFRFTEKPKAEVTGNPSIDNLNSRQLDECMRAFRGAAIACGNNRTDRPAQ